MHYPFFQGLSRNLRLNIIKLSQYWVWRCRVWRGPQINMNCCFFIDFAPIGMMKPFHWKTLCLAASWKRMWQRALIYDWKWEVDRQHDSPENINVFIRKDISEAKWLIKIVFKVHISHSLSFLSHLQNYHGPNYFLRFTKPTFISVFRVSRFDSVCVCVSERDEMNVYSYD